MPPTAGIALALVLALVFSLVPIPFVVYSPGPTFDVLGKQGQTAILQVEGAQSGEQQDPATGQLRMVTISELGGPGSAVTAMDILRAWIRPGYSVYRYSDIYPADITADQIQQASSAQMQSSHSTASVAALEYLGYDLPTVITIVGASEDMDAHGKVQPDDVLLSITTADGVEHPMDSPADPFALLETVAPGTTVKVKVKRDGTEAVESIETSADPTNPYAPGSKLGIMLSFDIDMPLDIQFHLEKVGGPSAGMIFALGIIDRLEGGTMVGDKVVAGTGALGYNGTVQPIGGVKQKMYGAQRDGAEYFLAPADNCDEVVGNEPRGIEVFAVGTLGQAVLAVNAIAAGDTEGLQTCEAVVLARDSAQSSD